jgi:hypothetical protein
MGQYYTPYVERANGEKMTLYSWDYNNGLKLMEHSYVGNNFVDAVISLIDENPAKVAWVGDYSDGVGCPENVYKACWHGDDEDPYRVQPEVERPYFMDADHNYIKHGYFVNHTQKVYVDMAEYMTMNPPDKWDCVISPLPLLTCVGNGQGGGDYHKGAAMDMVGDWFMDEIEFTDEQPHEDYADITADVLFCED